MREPSAGMEREPESAVPCDQLSATPAPSHLQQHPSSRRHVARAGRLLIGALLIAAGWTVFCPSGGAQAAQTQDRGTLGGLTLSVGRSLGQATQPVQQALDGAVTATVAAQHPHGQRAASHPAPTVAATVAATVKPLAGTPRPVVQPLAKAVLQPVLKPVLDSVVEPVLQPVVEPVLQPLLQPLAPVVGNQLAPVTGSLPAIIGAPTSRAGVAPAGAGPGRAGAWFPGSGPHSVVTVLSTAGSSSASAGSRPEVVRSRSDRPGGSSGPTWPSWPQLPAPLSGTAPAAASAAGLTLVSTAAALAFGWSFGLTGGRKLRPVDARPPRPAALRPSTRPA